MEPHAPIEVKPCGLGSLDIKARSWDGYGVPYFLHCSRAQWEDLVWRIKNGDFDDV